MRRLCQSSVVVIVLTLAPMHAWGDCAWVLWLQTATPVVGGAPVQRWSIVEGLAAKTECETRAERAIQAVLGSTVKAFRHERLGSTMTILTYVANDPNPYPLPEYSTYSCLPDTIDPRGPKGTGR